MAKNAVSLLIISVSYHGVGKHQWDVPLSDLPFILQVSVHS